MAIVTHVERNDGVETFKVFPDMDEAKPRWVALVNKTTDLAQEKFLTVMLRMYEIDDADADAPEQAVREGRATEIKWVRVRPPKSLQSRVQTEGPGCVDAAAIAKAQKVADDKAAEFLDWVQADLTAIDGTLARLQQALERADPELVAKVLKHLYRQFYRLRGQGGTFGYGLVSDVGCQLCRMVERFGKEDAEATVSARDMQALRVHMDALRLIIGQKMSGGGGATGKELLDSLNSVFERVTKERT